MFNKKRKENEAKRYLDHILNQQVLTPEEVLLSNLSDFDYRMSKSGFNVKETTEAIITWTDPDGGPAEYI